MMICISDVIGQLMYCVYFSTKLFVFFCVYLLKFLMYCEC